MARLLLKALGQAGLSPFLASTLRTLDIRGEHAVQERLRQDSLTEAERLIAHVRKLDQAARPGLWFTYHVHYKAPDWIGPRVADALGIAYVIAEGSRAPSRAQGPWALGHAGAEAALDRADAIFVMTDRDRMALAAVKPARQSLIDLPPFLDSAAWDGSPAVVASPRDAPRLLTVAMMRAGDKLSSYRLLAAALDRLRHIAWTLDIVGDGEARGDVEDLFAAFSPRVRFHGALDDRHALRDLYASADLLVWPAVNEAYGMVLLEAQLFGCPVVAGAFGGVASVVRDGETGTLAPPGNVEAFAQAVEALLAHPEERARLSAGARDFVTGERDIAQAASRLRGALAPLIAGNAA